MPDCGPTESGSRYAESPGSTDRLHSGLAIIPGDLLNGLLQGPGLDHLHHVINVETLYVLVNWQYQGLSNQTDLIAERLRVEQSWHSRPHRRAYLVFAEPLEKLITFLHPQWQSPRAHTVKQFWLDGGNAGYPFQFRDNSAVVAMALFTNQIHRGR
jgi:hypothetical protein